MIKVRKAQLKALALLLFAALIGIRFLPQPLLIGQILSLLFFITLGALTQAASARMLMVSKGFGVFFILTGIWFFAVSLYKDVGNPFGGLIVILDGALLFFPFIVKKWIIVSDPDPDNSPSAIRDIVVGYDNAIVRLRWIACWIDLVFFIACLLAADSILGNELYRQTIFVWIALGMSNYLVGEYFWGRTLGKLIAGIVVVNAQGGTPSLYQVLIRTALRVIEVNPIAAGGVPAGIAVIASKYKQRLGDMLADTYVIRKSDLPPP